MTSRYTPLPEQPRTLLVVDSAPENLDGVRQTLHEAGFLTLTATSIDEVEARLDAESISAIVASDAMGIGVLERVRSRSGVQPSIVLTGLVDEAAVAEAYAAGADDFVSKTASPVELVGRLRGLLRSRVDLERIARKERDAQAMLELTQALASSLDFSEILHTVVRRIAEVVNVDRASIVLVPDTEENDVGFVVATSDDREIANLQISLEKYPEILQVLKTHSPLTIEDAATHPLLDGVRESVPDNAAIALTLLPIVWRDEAMGVLFLRSAQKGMLSARDISFCRIVANATAIALRNARVMQSLRDQTQKVNFARFEAERRLRALKRYANLFTSAADGLAAVDPDGKMLFANPRAYALAGVDEADMRGQKLKELVDPEDYAELARVWGRLKAGDFPTGVDLRIQRPDGTSRIVSCAFSALLDSEGAILVSFRDVTSERGMEAELVETKEFLESLIDASVDGIVAANMRGRILVYNQGAERIYGYPQSDVIGKRNVTELYPSGQANEVMRMIRSPQHGGPGRLESVRFNAVDRDGATVPIMLSAAMIFDEVGRPSATVGIFTDLRDRLRVEERLAQAQQKLAVTEKQALIAELAGTAAHELNQPLTSVIGYGELLQRKLPDGSPEHHAADVIVREAERMADIVRKIGKITRYETKSYVGAQKILDLDRATGEQSVEEEGGRSVNQDDAADRSSPEIRVSHITARPSPFADTGKRERFEVATVRRATLALKGELEPPSPEEVLFTVLELNRTVRVEMQDEAIVHRYVEVFGALFPRRRFAVRLLDPDGPETLELVYATGRLAAEGRESVALSEEALARHELDPDSVALAGPEITPLYRPIFDEPGVGFDVPLLQGEILFGVMCVEYEPGLEEPTFDRSLIVPIAVQLAAALRNSRLLRESNYLRDNLSKLLDHANAPIVVIGRDRELRVINRAFLALTGAARDDLMGRDFLHLLPETERGRILPVFIRALRGESTSNFEVRVPRRSGGYSRIVINTASILSADGEIEGVIAIGRDLTELRELESQVIQAEKLATLGQLAAGVVHELNNPLTSISVYGEYLLRKGQRTDWEDGDLEKLGRIVESADRILRFARDLVTYARPSTEEPNFIEIRNVLEQSLLFCEHVVREGSVVVERRYSAEGASVYAIKGQLHQVFINLITNACHALDGAGGSITLATEREDDDHVRIIVEDSGDGIPESQRERIFEPFYSTKGEGKGTGLGLSIVRNIVQQHGGTIAVLTSELGGARFEIVLPARP